MFCHRPYLGYLCSNTPVLQKTVRGRKGRISGLAGSTSRLSHKYAKCVKLPAHQFSVSSVRGFYQTTVNYLKVPTDNNILELGKEFEVSSSVGAAFLTWRKLTLSRSQVRAESPFHKEQGLAIKGLPEERSQDLCKQELFQPKERSNGALPHGEPAVHRPFSSHLVSHRNTASPSQAVHRHLMSPLSHQGLPFPVMSSSHSRSINNFQQLRASRPMKGLDSLDPVKELIARNRKQYKHIKKCTVTPFLSRSTLFS